MRIYKIILSFTIALLVMLGMVACVSQTTEIKSFNVTIYTDPDTNVQYIIYRSGSGAGMSPRYTADGKLLLKEN